MAKQERTFLINRTKFRAEAKVVLPNGVVTTVFVQPQTNTPVPDGTVLDRNYALKNPRVAIHTTVPETPAEPSQE